MDSACLWKSDTCGDKVTLQAKALLGKACGGTGLCMGVLVAQ